MSDDLVVRLRAALDQAEKIAKEAHVEGVSWYSEEHLARSHHEGGAGLNDFETPFIAAWSPSRVLALIADYRVTLGRCVAIIKAFDNPAVGMWPDVSRRERSFAAAWIERAAGFWLGGETG